MIAIDSSPTNKARIAHSLHIFLPDNDVVDLMALFAGRVIPCGIFAFLEEGRRRTQLIDPQ
jgi:hypothetical protein